MLLDEVAYECALVRVRQAGTWGEPQTIILEPGRAKIKAKK